LGSNFAVWLLQSRCLSISSLRNLKFNTSVMSWPSYTVVKGLHYQFDGVNFTVFVLSTFRISWFAWNHLAMWDMTILNVFINSLKCLLEMSTPASSAKNMVSEIVSILKENSFMYITRSSGPSIDPWGTLCLIISHLERYLWA
jgi:hypothetical protein